MSGGAVREVLPPDDALRRRMETALKIADAKMALGVACRGGHLRMTIPADPKHDHDLIIGEALRAAGELLDDLGIALAKANAELQAAKREREEWHNAATKWEEVAASRHPAPPAPPAEQYRCTGCGEVLAAGLVDWGMGHARTDDDGKGNPVPVHCGPCEPYQAPPADVPCPRCSGDGKGGSTFACPDCHGTGAQPAETWCEWTQDYDENLWETSCKHAFSLSVGTPAENDMRFCCYCGKPLLAHPYADMPDDDEEETTPPAAVEPKACRCEQWAKGKASLDGAVFMLTNHGMEYTEPPFIYCPWCGGRIVVEGA